MNVVCFVRGISRTVDSQRIHQIKRPIPSSVFILLYAIYHHQLALSNTQRYPTTLQSPTTFIGDILETSTGTKSDNMTSYFRSTTTSLDIVGTSTFCKARGGDQFRRRNRRRQSPDKVSYDLRRCHQHRHRFGERRYIFTDFKLIEQSN